MKFAIKDFAEAFGDTEYEVGKYCGGLVDAMNFKYQVCSQEQRDKIIIDILKKCDSNELSGSGIQRIGDWEQGWKQNLEEFLVSNGSLSSLNPKDWHGDRPMRWRGDYIIAESDTFEQDFCTVFRRWLFSKYFADYQNIYEFGCGTGHNLAMLAKMFPAQKLFGLDWVEESQQLVDAVAKRYRWNMTGLTFDFFKPNKNIDILPNSLVYTSSALEQLGKDFVKFVDYLLAKKPKLCVNVECLNEFYDEDKLFDYMALRYHRKRNYLDGFYSYLRKLEREKKIKIITARRTGFGSLYHEGYMFVIWEVL